MTANPVLLVIILLSLYQHGRTQDSVFSVTPENIIAKLGFPARLDCQTDIEGAFVRWSYGGDTRVLQPAECNCYTLSNSSLYFNRTTHATGGDYTCLVFGSTFGRINGSITIAVNPEITPSGFSMTRNQGDAFALSISVTGTPHPDVTWLKDGANFTSELTGVTANVSGLQVTNAQYRTAGSYRVQATNCADTDSETYNIFIRFLPIVTMTGSHSKEVPVSTTVIVTCSVTSYPGSSIRWEQQTANNENIALDTATTRNVTSNIFSVITNSTLTFNSEQIKGASKFCCVATNVIGTTMQCLEFTERGAPPPPTGFIAKERTPNSIIVQWDPPSLDAVTYELSYRVENSNRMWNVTSLQNGETSFKLDNLQPNTSYTLRITALRNSIQSLPTPLITRTRISVPGDVLAFKVDSTQDPGTFLLTWQAPQNSVVDFYIVYIRGPNDYNRMMTVNGTKQGVNIDDLSENVEYLFAVQAVNDGGNGSISSYRSGVFCLTIPTITAQYVPHGTTVNITWDLSDAMYSSRNVMLVVAEESRATFTSELIDASYRQHCVANLRPNTRYEIRVIAILGCDNISSQLDVLTQSPTPVARPPSQNCIIFNVTTVESIKEETDSDTLEVWVIILIVLLPLLAVAIMMSIGIYCACKKRYTTKDSELPPVTNTSSQAPLSHHTRNPSTSSYTGSFASGATTPIRSPMSYHSRGYRPTQYNGRIDEQQSLGQQY